MQARQGAATKKILAAASKALSDAAGGGSEAENLQSLEPPVVSSRLQRNDTALLTQEGSSSL